MKRKIMILAILSILVLSMVGCGTKKQMTTDDMLNCNPGIYAKFEGSKDIIKDISINTYSYHTFHGASYDVMSCEYAYRLKEPRVIMGSEVTGMLCYFNLNLYELAINKTDKPKMVNYLKTTPIQNIISEMDIFSDCSMSYWD